MADENVGQTESVESAERSEIPAAIAAKMDEILNREPETESGGMLSEESAPDVSADANIDSEESQQETNEQAVVSKDSAAVEKEPEDAIDTDVLDSIISGKQEEVQVQSPQDIKLDLDPEIVGVDVKNALDAIAVELSRQKQSLASQQESLKFEQERLLKERNDAFTSQINNHFDKYAKDLPSIGETSKMTERQAMERKRIYAHADMEAKIRHIPMEQAISETVKMFKSVGNEKEIRTTLITDLNKQKSKFMNTPTRKQTSTANRKFASEDERIRARMDEVYNQIGIET